MPAKGKGGGRQAHTNIPVRALLSSVGSTGFPTCAHNAQTGKSMLPIEMLPSIQERGSIGFPTCANWAQTGKSVLPKSVLTAGVHQYAAHHPLASLAGGKNCNAAGAPQGLNGC